MTKEEARAAQKIYDLARARVKATAEDLDAARDVWHHCTQETVSKHASYVAAIDANADARVALKAARENILQASCNARLALRKRANAA